MDCLALKCLVSNDIPPFDTDVMCGALGSLQGAPISGRAK